MPRSRRRIRRPAPAAKPRSWRLALLGWLSSWNRYQVGRVIEGVILTWLIGAVGLYLVERRANTAFASLVESLWSVWALLFSGLDDAYTPKTGTGRILAMILMVAGVGLAGLFTASVASLLVERYLRRRDVTHFQMDDHLVLCNWTPRGLEWIREVHSKILTEPRPIVIIHDNPDEIDLPDKQDEPAFNDVYIVKGDPTNEVILHRATVPQAYSVVVLSDTREGKHADGKSILICIAIRQICRGEHQPNLVVECHNPSNRHHLLKAGASEVVSSDSLGLRLLARSALFHGMSQFYQELLTVRRDANEVYLVPAPKEMVGLTFNEVSELFLRYRNDRRSCLLIGIQRGEEMMINPIGDEAGPLQAHDQLILLSRIYPSAAQPLPTSPSITSLREEKPSK
ncbi:MAG TPA: NAD-binding protein [Isosphaeraceae bacterium]|nr:NAD-binding protein [Isosphaeraceae bacterium]